MTTTDLRTPPTLPPEITNELLAVGSATDPYPVYQRMRRDFPVAEALGAVNLFRYDDVAALLRHPGVSTDDRTSTLHQSLAADRKLTEPYLSQLDNQSFLHRDPPEHTRLRRLVGKGFTPRRIEALRPFIQHQVDHVLDQAATRGHLELVADLAYPLPVEVICDLLGVPAEDRAFLATWPRTQLCCSFESSSLKAAADLRHTGPNRQVEADRIQQQLADYFALLIDRRRRTPGDDLVSALLAAEEHGEQLTDDEINATLRLLFVAGYENAVNLLGHGTLALLRHPDQWAALREDPTRAGGAVDEALRYDAPFQFTQRVATADLELGGYRIARGRHVIAWIAAANRDPARFPHPNRFDIRRTDNRHLAFGTGIHACLGGPLARREAEVVLTTLTRRLVGPHLDLEPPCYRTDVFRSLDQLPITAQIRPAA